MTNEKAIMCLEDMKIKVPIPKAAKQARENNEALDVAIKALKNEPHWIPVTERLPKVNGRYLVTRGLNACGAMWNRVYLLNYSDLMGLKSERIWWDGNVGKSDFERIDDVLAWMSLPEAYKGVSDGRN